MLYRMGLGISLVSTVPEKVLPQSLLHPRLQLITLYLVMNFISIHVNIRFYFISIYVNIRFGTIHVLVEVKNVTIPN